MNPSYNYKNARINSVTDECALLSNERVGRYCAPAQSSLIEGSNNTREESYGSTTSECRSAVSIAKPMSTSALTVGDESLSSRTSPGITYANLTPQVYMQQAGAPAYHPVMYGQRYHTQQSYNFQPTRMVPPSPGYVHMVPPSPGYVNMVPPSPGYVNMVPPSPGYVNMVPPSPGYMVPPSPGYMVPPSPGYVNVVPHQVQAVSPMMGISQPRPLQSQNVVHPINQHQSQITPQYWASMPMPTSVPRMVSYSGIQQRNTDTQPVSPNMFSSTVGTPVPNYVSSPGYVNFGSPGYVNSYGYINTPVQVSCTPNPCFTTSADVPPLFHLNNQNLRRSTIPEQISCSINPAPLPSELELTNESPVPVSTACNPSPMNLQTAAAKNVSVHTSADNIEQSAAVEREEDEDLWTGTCKYTECHDNGGSNLFVTWSGEKLELGKKLRHYKLEVRQVLKTSDENVCNVVFESHPCARKAFTMQREIRLRMVPPRNSHRNWLRNPSPKFLVKFETKRRLPVKKGKAECHDLVGELLMSNCQEQQGCVIWADQLKGHRIRVRSCDGNFMFPGGRVVQMKGVSTEDDGNTSLGWISYRCKHTRESFVIRRSGNLLGDYIYRE